MQKSMKKIFSILLLVVSAWLFSDCKKNNDSRDNFVGIYSVNETWVENSTTLTKPAFSMPIYKSSVDSKLILLNNFSNYGIGITAEGIVTGDLLTIPSQLLANGKTITGSGSLSSMTLTFTYTESYNDITFKITSTAKIK